MGSKHKKTQIEEDSQTAADVKERFKPLTEEALRTYTDSSSFSRGQQYFRDGSIVDPVLRGAVLSARSMGQSGGPYKLRVELVGTDESRSGSLEGYSCDCPRGGFCKHIVALLLLWVHSPQEIEVRTDTAILLKDRTREELLAIITTLLKREPDLEQWVEIALATSTKTQGSSGKLSVNPTAIKKQAASLFSHITYEWGEARDIANKLDALVEMGDRYADAGQWANAQAVYSAIAEATIDHARGLEDEDGNLDGIMTDCAEGLRRCIDAQPALAPADRLSPEMRLQLFRSLFDIWQDSLDYDNLAMDEDVAELIARTATDSERANVERWLEAGSGDKDDGRRVLSTRRMDDDEGEDEDEDDYDEDYEDKEIGGYPRDWGARPRLHFLLTLKEKDGLSEDEILAMYRKAGLYDDLVYRMLEMGRVDEAFKEARKHLKTPYQTTRFASEVLKLGPEWKERALKFIEDLVWGEKDKRDEATYLRWLEDNYIKYGMADKALDVTIGRFKIDPDEQTYASVKNAANMPGQPQGLWAEKRPGLIATLETKGNWGALVNVYLVEENVKKALSALDKMERAAPRSTHSAWSGYGGSYLDGRLADAQLNVARAAEKDYPNEARAIYQNLAGRYIDLRNRGSYQQAAELLVLVKALYEKQGQEDEWQAYIANLRTEYKTLRALKEELDTRGLV